MLDLMSFEKQSLHYCWLLLLGLLSSLLANAQQPLPEDYVRARINPDSRLFNGREYIRNGTPAKGSPFFESDSLQLGSVSYDGILYSYIALEYDMVSDQLIIHNFTGDALISLTPEKITFFSIAGHRFRYIAPAGATPTPAALAPAAPTLPETGFYEELYANPRLALLARRKKALIFPSSQDEQSKYVQADRYFLLIDANAYSIHSENDLLTALKDEKDPLKKFIRKNKLSFNRQHFENSLLQTTIYYQEIKQ
jgi:hypothetical protein